MVAENQKRREEGVGVSIYPLSMEHSLYRELKKLNSPKINEPVKKWATELNRTLSTEEIQMAKKHMLTIYSHKGNANQNHTKIPPHPCQKSHHQKYH
jgi:hypothetical protein